MTFTAVKAASFPQRSTWARPWFIPFIETLERSRFRFEYKKSPVRPPCTGL
jgi:hypothetical protein